MGTVLRWLLVGTGLLALTWTATVVLARRLPPGVARDLASVLPDCVTTARRLRRDPRVPGRAKVAVGFAALWVLSPIDLIPEFLPVIGPLDDVIVVALALRYAARRVPREVLFEVWPGEARILERLVPAPRAASVTSVQLQNPPEARRAAVRRSRVLNRLTIGWNLAEGLIAVTAGAIAGSVSLVGFGLDSGIEVSAALALAWRLRKESGDGCMADFDRRATRMIALSFAGLAAYVSVESIRNLLGRTEPEASAVGIALAMLSLLVMPVLARAKRRLAPVLGSQAAASEADQTRLCAILSAVLLVGLGLNAVLGWWWADPAAGVVIAALAGVEAVRTWRAEALADTCCG